MRSKHLLYFLILYLILYLFLFRHYYYLIDPDAKGGRTSYNPSEILTDLYPGLIALKLQ